MHIIYFLCSVYNVYTIAHNLRPCMKQVFNSKLLPSQSYHCSSTWTRKRTFLVLSNQRDIKSDFNRLRRASHLVYESPLVQQTNLSFIFSMSVCDFVLYTFRVSPQLITKLGKVSFDKVILSFQCVWSEDHFFPLVHNVHIHIAK